MKANKKKILIHNMFLLLTENEYVPVCRMASVLGLSESTIRRNLDMLDEMVRNAGYGQVLKIPGKGVHLKKTADADEQMDAVIKAIGNYELQNILTDEQQIYKYLFELLKAAPERLTLEQLSQSMYDSIPVVRKKLSLAGEWLSLFGLQLRVKKNYGVYLEGGEENVRMAICHLVSGNELYDAETGIAFFCKGIDLDRLKRCISDLEKSWNFKFSEDSFYALLVYAALSVCRHRKNSICLDETEYQTVIQYNEYQWAKSLFRMINEEFGTKIGEDEIVFFSIQQLCSGTLIDFRYGDNFAYRYDEKLKEFIHKIISVVSEILNADLTGDEELYYGLLNHIRPAIFRMRFEKHSTDTLTDFIKEEYKDTFRVSWALSILFEEYYGINISSTELSYITLYIQAALERTYKLLKIALVTELGMGLNQMFCNRIRMAVPRIESISILSLHEFKTEILKQYDLIITTSKLEAVSEKIVQINAVLNEDAITLINKRLRQLEHKNTLERSRFDVSCHSLFDPRLIFQNVSVSDKKELIGFLANALTSMGYVSERYAGSVLKREKTVSTYIGNGVAIPHGTSGYANDSKVAIAFLSHPIPWNESESEMVDSVFLLAFRIEDTDSSKQVQMFYKVFLELIQTDESLKYLRGMSSEELYKYLVQ